jgi:hypothetical protein
MNKKDLKVRIFEIIIGNPPVKDKMLYATLGTEFIHLTKKQIYGAVDELIMEGKIIQLSYRAIDNTGALFFPPDSDFKFGVRDTS